MNLVILASGSGKRLKKLTKSTPKCLIKINGKSLLEYLDSFIKYFNKTYLVAGFKANLIKKFLKRKNIKIINNYNYRSTNMVYSLFCASSKIKGDTVICYSDIIFDHKIFNLLKKTRGTVMPVKSDWLELWKKRMPYREIKKDAENIEIKKGFLTSLGQPINSIYPKNQFMGILKISKKDFKIMRKLFVEIKNKKIDFTNFINLAIKKKNLKIKCIKTRSFWFEIDKINDVAITSKLLRKIY